MERYETVSPEEDKPGRTHGRTKPRRWRLVPPAITPIESVDIAAGLFEHLRHRGRDRFRLDVKSFLNVEDAATYTSFRRTLAGCFHELADNAPAARSTVLVPAFCSSDYLDAIEGVGLEAVRYDVDPETFSLDSSSLGAKLGAETLAVVTINVLGYSSPMVDVQRRLADRDVFLVEALGYALGSAYEGRRLGTFGDCAVLNFQQGKPIPVGGGMVVSQNDSLRFGDDGRPAVGPNVGSLAGYAALSHPRPYYAYSRLSGVLEELGVSNAHVTTHPEPTFDVEYAPPFATISDFQGAIAHRVFERLERDRKQRARTADFYATAVSSIPGVSHPDPIDGLENHQHVRFPLLARTETLRDQIRDTLISAGIQATTLYDWPVLDPETYPGASELQQTIVTLPTHPYVDERDRQTVIEIVRDVVANAGFSG